MQAIGVFLIQMLVFWPVWQWYLARLGDPADDASVVVALGTAVVFLLLKKPAQKSPQIPLLIPIICLLLYTVTFPLFSPLLRAIIAVFALSYTLNYWRFGDRLQLWLYGLLLLSLPVLSPMQFYLSYPVRIIVGRLATFFLQLFGFPVVFEGIAFNWGGEYIWIDELCSGIRKLWAGLYFTFALVAFYDLRTKKTIAVTGFAVLAFIMANVLRTTFLFYVKADFFAIPWWLHKWGGIVMFLFAAIATVCFAQGVKKRGHNKTPVVERTEIPGVLNRTFFPKTHPVSWRTTGVFLLLCMTAALVPFLPVKSIQRDSLECFPGWPVQIDGKPLQQLELSEREERLARDFPGRIARFTDGEREFIIRWTTRSSRAVQSAWDGFHGLGYRLHFGPIWRDQQGHHWRTFEAKNSNETLRVLERIHDDTGNSWTDTSSWYWTVLLGKTDGPWWVVTIVENIEK